MKINLNELNKLYEIDGISRINREVDIGQHLPQDIIGKGLEFTAIREITNEELNRLWVVANRVLDNLFIHSSDELGIDNYIKLLDMEITGDLEERRKKVFLEWNKKVVWTHRTLIEWLDESIGNENYKLEINYNEYFINVKLIMETARIDQKFIHDQLRQIIPANLGIRWTVVYKHHLYWAGVCDGREHRVFEPFVLTDVDHKHEMYVGTAWSVREYREMKGVE